MKKRTSQLLAELEKLAKEARENIYERISKAAQVLADTDWIESVHGGSDLKARDALESHYFRDLSGYVTLSKLLLLHSKIEQKEWNELGHNLAAIEALYDDRTIEKHEKGERTSWKKVAEERGDKLLTLEREVAYLRQENKRLLEELEQTKARVARLEGKLEFAEAHLAAS